MRLLNVGCGKRHHPDWTNVDLVATGPGVIACDIAKGLPFRDGTFDAVYHSHVLEHLRKDEALPFLQECRRVLKSGGIIRIAVPDLERICRTYLSCLDGALEGDASAARKYEWIILELLDQMTREKSGGAMGQYLKRQPVPEEDFVIERLGEEAAQIIRKNKGRPPSRTAKPSRGLPWLRDVALGRFVRGGEVHRWMYDRWSLARLLERAGFRDPRVTTAKESAIPGWSAYALDASPDGKSFKPDSLYMEAQAPA